MTEERAMEKAINFVKRYGVCCSPFNFNSDYQWRDREGNYISLTDMPSKRLFYTYLMLWNHIVPENMRIWNNYRYKFDRTIYTAEYIKTGFKAMRIELSKRDDLGPKMKEVLLQIEEYLFKLATNEILVIDDKE